MAATTIDELQVIITAQNKQFQAALRDVSSQLDGVADQAERSGGKMSAALQKVGKVAKVATVTAFASLTAATAAASKASWDQVSAVQQASATLGRYYDSAEDVSKVQQELIKYAQSDMGVLFNRKDLFAAAGNLAMYGSSAKDVTKQVQILSRGMASNVLTWDEMNAVVGRVISSGKLSRTEFEMLAKAGYNLDASLANSSVTADEFFNILDNSIPKDISQDMNNIVPVGIRLQTAFRNIGNAILGVNNLQDGFFGGSLGDRIIKGMQGATSAANQMAPKLREVVTSSLAVFDSVASYLSPALSSLGETIVSRLIPAIQTLITSPLATFLGSTLVFAVRTTIQAFDGLVMALSFIVEHIGRFGPVLAMAVGGFAGFRLAILASNAAMAAKSALLVLMGTQFMVYNGALITVRGATVAATVAQAALNLAMKANPIGILITLAGTLAGALGFMATQTDKSKSSTDRLKAAQDALRTSTDLAKDAQDRLRGALLTQEGAALAVERAQLNYNQAVRDYGPASLEAREAEHNLKQAKEQQKRAADEAKKATQEQQKAEQDKARDLALVQAEHRNRDAVASVTNAMKGQSDQISILRKDLQRTDGTNVKYHINGNTSGNISAIDQLRNRLSALNGTSVSYSINSYETKMAATGTGVPYKNPAQRYRGGPVTGGQAYLVGENRDGSINKTTELFVPRTSGQIVSSKDFQNLLTGNSAMSDRAPLPSPTMGHLTVNIAGRTVLDGVIEGINDRQFMTNGMAINV